jgi:hypothetical protein
VFGILFLDWSGGKVLLVYYADTRGSMYAVSTLAAYAAAQTEPEFQAWIKDGITPLKRLRIVVGTALIGFLGPVLVAIPFGGFLAMLPSRILRARRHWLITASGSVSAVSSQERSCLCLGNCIGSQCSRTRETCTGPNGIAVRALGRDAACRSAHISESSI